MVAIHHRKDSFSEKWIAYCQLNKIEYKIVDCCKTDIIEELRGCSYLLWHWHQNDVKAQLFARQLFQSLRSLNIKVFPNIDTCWHFDDKVGQKYLFEVNKIPFIKSYVFYDLESSLLWINKTEFPKVFKLRNGAGAENVKLVLSRSEAQKLAKKAFFKGFTHNRFSAFNERVWHFRRDKTLKSFINILRGIGRIFLPNPIKSSLPIEKNYFYMQEFIPNNDSDIRVIVIGSKRAFAIKRMVRKGDFRASGSGKIIYEKEQIPLECVRIAFQTSKKLKLQSAAYDFVFQDGKPLIVEVSYAFTKDGYRACPGYWNEKLQWIEGSFFPEYFIIEDLLV